MTDGNLSRHLTVLIEADLIEVWRGGQSGRPHTMYRLTDQGRLRFIEYIRELERVVMDAQALAASVKHTGPKGMHQVGPRPDRGR